MRSVAIVGVGQTVGSLRRNDVSFPEMIREAVVAALNDAGLTMQDVDAIVYGQSPELFVGVNQPEKWCVDQFGGRGKPHMRIHTGGTVGASTGIAGFYHVACGLFDTVLAIAGDKLSESPVQLGLSTVYDPIMGRQFACGAPSAVALQVRRYMHRYGITERQAAKVAVKNRRNALKNPYATLKIPYIDEDMVLNSPMISSPLRLMDVCPASDQACAMVFTTADRARALTRRPAWVRAVSAVAEGVNYVDRDWAEPIALKQAAANAYKQAGIGPKDIDCAELYEAFTYQELLWSEGVGFCEPGGGGRMIDEGRTFMDGDLPINASGGVLSSNSIGASAMLRQAEAALQVMGKAGEHQVPKPVRYALAHGWGGAIQFQTVMILGAEPPT